MINILIQLLLKTLKTLYVIIIASYALLRTPPQAQHKEVDYWVGRKMACYACSLQILVSSVFLSILSWLCLLFLVFQFVHFSKVASLFCFDHIAPSNHISFAVDGPICFLNVPITYSSTSFKYGVLSAWGIPLSQRYGCTK